MERDPRAYLWDARQSADAIAEFARGRTFDDYVADSMLRSAVERQFEIIGEALRQLEKAAPAVALRLPERSQAIAFRNILIDGYDSIDDGIVWRAIHDSLPALRARVAALLDEMGEARAHSPKECLVEDPALARMSRGTRIGAG